jgi:hypothetical protein
MLSNDPTRSNTTYKGSGLLSDRSARRLGRAGVVVDMTFPAVLLLDLGVGNVHVLDRRVVVLVRVRRREMAPVLASMEIVRHVVVLVTVLGGLVLVMPL